VELCLRAGGSISGEHGIGVEKQDFMALQFGEADLAFMQRIHLALDPDDLCNPGKLFPGSKGCARGCVVGEFRKAAAAC
jgi:FAD/FMN-containing dehydrogenase